MQKTEEGKDYKDKEKWLGSIDVEVYKDAEQGGSESGLKYKYNWLTNHGGQLDNVKGGSTLKIYVTTNYQVKYYLNDIELGSENDENKKENKKYQDP